MRRGDSFSDVSGVDGVRHAQQQLQDLLYYAHRQHQQQLLPRVDSVRCLRSSNGASIEVKFCKQHPESLAGCQVSLTVALRVAGHFPRDHPMIACVAGGENLPQSLSLDGQLKLPWLADGWKEDYTLVLFARDFCSHLEGPVVAATTSSEPVDPHLLPMVSPRQHIPPSAPTLYDVEDTHGTVSLMDMNSLPRKVQAFTCKWRDTQRTFSIDAPRTMDELEVELVHVFPALTGARLELTEFNSTRAGVLLASDQHWLRLLGQAAPVIYLQIQGHCKHIADTADLLGLKETGVKGAIVRPPSPPRLPARERPLQRPSVVSSLDWLLAAQSPARAIPWTDLNIQKIVGNGSSCRVYKGKWRGTDVAVKVFTGTIRAAVEKEYANEVETMTRLGAHPSLVLFLAVTPNPLSIVFEYLPFSLFELINGVDDVARKLPPFPTSWTRRVTMMLDIARGLQFLHSFNIIHRDMKSLNLLVTPEGRVKLADFGISRVAKQSEMMTGCCGTYQWMAPEVLQSANYSISADIYSLGIIIWEICEVAPPFADLAPPMVPAAVIRDKKRPLFSVKTPQPLQELARNCWEEEASKRPCAAQVAAKLQSFFPQF